ncbi:hypothetical protein JW756_06850 [Candidatus Woesearchaeota archaeon]|nr:hypothetical protein [Candidatus Woesearchaeota archaeon]
MTQYFDLNSIVQEYTVSKNGGKKELDELTGRLSNVPVSLEKLEAMLKENYGVDVLCFTVKAEFVQPDMRISLLDELVENYEDADEITERMTLPYPLICLSGEFISKNFYKRVKYGFGKLIAPDARDQTARVLKKPGVGGVAVTFERDNKLEYIEIVLAKDF